MLVILTSGLDLPNVLCVLRVSDLVGSADGEGVEAGGGEVSHLELGRSGVGFGLWGGDVDVEGVRDPALAVSDGERLRESPVEAGDPAQDGGSGGHVQDPAGVLFIIVSVPVSVSVVKYLRFVGGSGLLVTFNVTVWVSRPSAFCATQSYPP